ncbi:hypothetical protein Cni_G01333 [Canna indica]|uniref:Uncharacterized protein n=1 Tax=Canna indica TaxID=4628 RepID=A0AAQ3JP43_9LILI|nr:hypothetical protein Cni_G01333 [Canna indica]
MTSTLEEKMTSTLDGAMSGEELLWRASMVPRILCAAGEGGILVSDEGRAAICSAMGEVLRGERRLLLHLRAHGSIIGTTSASYQLQDRSSMEEEFRVRCHVLDPNE